MALSVSDIQALFDQKLVAAIQKDPKRVQKIGKVTFQFTVDGAGSWVLDCGAPSIKAGKAPNPTCSFSSSAPVFSELMENPRTKAITLFMSGKIKVDGDAMLAMKLGDLLDLLK